MVHNTMQHSNHMSHMIWPILYSLYDMTQIIWANSRVSSAAYAAYQYRRSFHQKFLNTSFSWIAEIELVLNSSHYQKAN